MKAHLFGDVHELPALAALCGSALFVAGCYLSHERPEPCDAGMLCGVCVGECNVETGEGCAEDEGCYAGVDRLHVTPTTFCLPSRGRAVGAPCDTVTDCASGLGCLESPDRRFGFCVPHCCGEGDCPTGMGCFPTHSPADGGLAPEIPLVAICVWTSEECDVVRQTGCPAGAACYPATLPACLAPGARGLGEACAGVADCAPGMTCVEDDGRALCRRVCAVDADCEPGTRCDVPAWGVGLCSD